MKQLIICIVLAVCLVGCAEKPKFSINEDDTAETYENNPVFTKVKIYDDDTVKGEKFAYQFIDTPISTYGVETRNLNVLGGTIFNVNDGLVHVTLLTIKGKESFGKLKDRLSKLKEFTCSNFDVGNSMSFNCHIDRQQSRVKLAIHYNNFSDIVSFNYTRNLGY